MRLVPAVLGALIGVAGLVAVDRVLSARSATPPLIPSERHWEDRFPDVVLQTHDGRSVRFYEDLIKDKIVAINFMYVGCTKF